MVNNLLNCSVDIIILILVLTIRVVTGDSNQPLKLDKREVFCQAGTIEKHIAPHNGAKCTIQQLCRAVSSYWADTLHTFFTQLLHFCVALSHST